MKKNPSNSIPDHLDGSGNSKGKTSIMPRGGARPGSGPKPRPPEQLRSTTFTTRCTPAEKELYEALKTKLDTERKEQQEKTK
jgi:hypothetical protein